MPYIIAATDFTEVSENAVHYACKLALDLDVNLHILNCYSIPIAFSDISVPLPMVDTEQIAADAMERLINTVRQQYPQLTISFSVVYGGLNDAVDEYAAKNGKPIVLVTGNHYNPENPAWIDSALLDAFRHLKTPVLAIPTDTNYTGIRKLGFAYDNKFAGSDLALTDLKELTLLLNAELHVFYADHDVMRQESKLEVNDGAKQILASAHPLYHVSYESDVDTAILDFAAKYNIDWLVLMPRKVNFFETIFRKSHTKLIVNHAVIPILALHHN